MGVQLHPIPDPEVWQGQPRFHEISFLPRCCAKCGANRNPAQAFSQHLDASVCTQQIWPVIVQLQQQQKMPLAIIWKHNWEQTLCWTIPMAHPRRCEMKHPCSKTLTVLLAVQDTAHPYRKQKLSFLDPRVNRVGCTNQMGFHPRLAGAPLELQGVLQEILQEHFHDPSLCYIYTRMLTNKLGMFPTNNTGKRSAHSCEGSRD